MKLRLSGVFLALSIALALAPVAALAQQQPGVQAIPQPAGVAQELQELASEHSTHTVFTFDRDMLQSFNGVMNGGSGAGELSSVTVESYRYQEPAFYIPETMRALVAAYSAAGWQHLVDQHVTPRDSASPVKPLTDLWLHFHGTEIDGLTVLIRAPREMTVIEVAGMLKPLDLLHLGGHFGIPNIDPNAVMVPAPPGEVKAWQICQMANRALAHRPLGQELRYIRKSAEMGYAPAESVLGQGQLPRKKSGGRYQSLGELDAAMCAAPAPRKLEPGGV